MHELLSMKNRYIFCFACTTSHYQPFSPTKYNTQYGKLQAQGAINAAI